MPNTISGAFISIAVWVAGWSFIGVWMVFLNWLDNRSGRMDPDAAPVDKK